MASIDLLNLSKSWGSSIGVDNLSIHVNDGELLVLLGPSGCGKTTTMRMIAGLEVPTEGKIKIDNKDVTKLEPKYRDVAMVFQTYSLYPQMTVYENIRFTLRARNIKKLEHNERVLEAAKMVQLTKYLQRKPNSLSGGQRQRVALARAIVRSPIVFLMDEPLSNLDARLRLSMRNLIKELHLKLQTTIVYVTHDQLEAMTLADRIIVMNEGKIEQIGTPKEIYEDPNTMFVAEFVGLPSMNLFNGNLLNGFFKANGINIPIKFSNNFDNVVLGIRPEDLSLVNEDEGNIIGVVNSVEMIGDVTLVTLKVNSNNCIAKLNKDVVLNLGDKISLKTSSRLLVFDKTTGKRIKNE
ncbi:MAG: ABC transporter ATP-binding protein [Chloroflexi bacterium]|nr:ABC transporter ATP-binding protein [Chloroflexota bacterium]